MPGVPSEARVLLVSRGSSGDIYPFLGVATALMNRGVRVGFVANPYFAESVRRIGAEFFPMGAHLRPDDRLRIHPIASNRWVGTLFWLRVLSGSAANDIVPALRPAIAAFHPDLILAHQNCLGAPWIAQEFGLEWWNVVLAPCTFPSAFQPSVYSIGLDTTRLPMFVRRIQNWCVRAVINAMVDPPVNRTRRAHGLAPQSDTFCGEMLRGVTLAMFAPAFRPPAPDDPKHLSIVGFPWFDPPGTNPEPDDAVEAFLRTGDPPVVVAMGSMFSMVHARTNDNLVRACLSLNRRIIVIGAISEDLPADPRVLVIPRATYSELFARSAAVVHHGGIGTTARALRVGVPSVVVPFAVDQFDNAARLRRLGVAAVSSPKASPRRFAHALARVLDDPRIRERARTLAPIMALGDGAESAAERIARHLEHRSTARDRGAATTGSSGATTPPFGVVA